VLETYIDVAESSLYIALPGIEAENVIGAEEVVGSNVLISLILV
jgi:hypothetical protein